MIDFGKDLNELKEDLENIISKHYKNYLEDGLYLQYYTSTDINNYLRMLYEIGYIDKTELNTPDILYVFNSAFRTLIKMEIKISSLKISKYIIDNNELEKYIYYKNITN